MGCNFDHHMYDLKSVFGNLIRRVQIEPNREVQLLQSLEMVHFPILALLHHGAHYHTFLLAFTLGC